MLSPCIQQDYWKDYIPYFFKQFSKKLTLARSKDEKKEYKLPEGLFLPHCVRCIVYCVSKQQPQAVISLIIIHLSSVYREREYDNRITLVKSSRIYTGQYTFPILLLNDDNMLEEHKGREKKIVYERLFQKIHILYFDGRKFWIWETLGHAMNIFTKWHFHNA